LGYSVSSSSTEGGEIMPSKIIVWDDKQARHELMARLSLAKRHRLSAEDQWETNEQIVYGKTNRKAPTVDPNW
jgi:hypothetical protein